jgi:transposase
MMTINPGKLMPNMLCPPENEFGVQYHRAHVSRLLAACGWSCQKPERRSVERNEATIAHWKRYKWAAL